MNKQASFGGFIFDINTAPFEQMVRTNNANWSKIAQLGTYCALHLTGKEQTISISGKTHRYISDTKASVDTLREMQDKPYTLGLYPRAGSFENLGLWVLKSIEETLSAFGTGSSADVVSFRLELEFYGFQDTTGQNQ